MYTHFYCEAWILKTTGFYILMSVTTFIRLTNANPLSRRSSAGCCGISLCMTRLKPS